VAAQLAASQEGLSSVSERVLVLFVQSGVEPKAVGGFLGLITTIVSFLDGWSI
jgi:hypothetical protein